MRIRVKKIRVGKKMLKSMCTVMLAIVLVVIGLFPVNVVNAKSQIIPNDETGIPDKILYQAILFELDKKSDKQFTREEAASLYSLGDFYFTGENKNKKIKTLKGIENLVNLISLNISGKLLTNLEGVECLTELQTLRIRNGNLENLNEVKNLSKLMELSLENVKLNDWTAVSNLTNLEKLCIKDCGLTYNGLKTVASKMSGLKSLGVSGISLKDLTSLRGLVKLKELSISDNKLKSLSGIETLTELHSLYVSNNELTDLNGIEHLTELQNLYVSNNKLTDLNGIEKLTKLVSLDVSKNKITRLPSLKKLTNLSLEYTWFDSNKISEKVFKRNLPSHAIEKKMVGKQSNFTSEFKKEIESK